MKIIIIKEDFLDDFFLLLVHLKKITKSLKAQIETECVYSNQLKMSDFQSEKNLFILRNNNKINKFITKNNNFLIVSNVFNLEIIEEKIKNHFHEQQKNPVETQ